MNNNSTTGNGVGAEEHNAQNARLARALGVRTYTKAEVDGLIQAAMLRAHDERRAQRSLWQKFREALNTRPNIGRIRSYEAMEKERTQSLKQLLNNKGGKVDG